MFETLKRLYSAGAIDIKSIESAVKKSWITSEQASKIVESK